jgi:transglutaminase-like putative cysteine protease
MSVVDAIRKANRPGVPEDSIRLRVASWGAVLVAIGACASLHEVSAATETAAAVLISLGMVVSYRTRQKPPNWIKVAVAVGATGALVWFFRSVSGSSPDFALVENPLTLLLVSVLVLHSFHVPARRDLLFSLAASAGLMAVGGAQAIDLQFGFYVLAWAGFCLWGLCEMWTSASGGGRISIPSVVCALGALSAAAAAVFLVLPAPIVSARVAFLSRAGVGGAVGVPGALAGDSGTPAQLARAGNTNGSTRVGGYLGFAQTLDTALRGKLGDQLVMQVRANRPTFWVGETFDTWLGESWVQSKTRSQALRQSLPFVLPPSTGSSFAGQPDLQTFYVAGTSANLVFHAESASELWFPSLRVFVSPNGTIVSPIGLGSGSIYTVESLVDDPTPAQLRRDDKPLSLPAATIRQSLQLPHSYPRATSLARSITAHDSTTYDKVASLIGWMSRHTRYSTDIPPLPKGADSVDEFLFGNRVGFCEQISTSLAVMLRSIGIPAREAVGFVPGGYNPITDLFQVHANDAHAWVQVWFPGYGWQSFDPTAVVPSTAPSPGVTALHDVAGALRRVPWVPVAAVVIGVGLTAWVVRLRRRRPPGWDVRVANSMERAGSRVGRARMPGETLPEYARSLDGRMGHGVHTWADLAREVEANAYGGREPAAAAQREMLRTAKHTRVPRRGRIRVDDDERRGQRSEELTSASSGS